MNSPIRLLIVDDSALMRKAIALMLKNEPDIEVCGYARNGQEAIEKVQDLNPDIVTLDIEMPVMDGLTALRYVMRMHPVPVIMFSAMTTEGAEMTLDALAYGAVDFMPKFFPAVIARTPEIRNQLVAKIRAIHRNHHPAGAAMREVAPAKETPSEIAEKGDPLVDREVILIGASTGGPQTLQRMIPRLPRDFPVPIIIVQHMPATFTKSLAERLDKLSQLKVYEARDGEPLQPGQVYIAPGGQHLYLKQRMGSVYLRIGDEGEDIIYKPSVNVTAESVAAVYRNDAVGIMLTGMGNDGLEGFKKMKAKQAYLMAQSRETCVIYGMPRAVIEAGIVDEILSPESMIHRLIKGNAVSRPVPGSHRTLI